MRPPDRTLLRFVPYVLLLLLPACFVVTCSIP